jgi:hypothetical protein
MKTIIQKVLFTKKECDLILKKYNNNPVDESENNDTRKYRKYALG